MAHEKSNQSRRRQPMPRKIAAFNAYDTTKTGSLPPQAPPKRFLERTLR